MNIMVDNNNGNDSKINVVHDDIINENIDTIDIIDDHNKFPMVSIIIF